jgi:hypothetical protein
LSLLDSDLFASAIRADDVDSLQTLLATVDFNYNRSVPKFPSENDAPISLLAFSARSRALRCVKFLLMNHATVAAAEFVEAIRGGQLEVIRMIDNAITERPPEEALSVAVQSFQFDVFEWLVNDKFCDSLAPILGTLATVAAKSGNLPALLLLIRRGLAATLRDDASLLAEVYTRLCSPGGNASVSSATSGRRTS